MKITLYEFRSQYARITKIVSILANWSQSSASFFFLIKCGIMNEDGGHDMDRCPTRVYVWKSVTNICLLADDSVAWETKTVASLLLLRICANS